MILSILPPLKWRMTKHDKGHDRASREACLTIKRLRQCEASIKRLRQRKARVIIVSAM